MKMYVLLKKLAGLKNKKSGKLPKRQKFTFFLAGILLFLFVLFPQSSFVSASDSNQILLFNLSGRPDSQDSNIRADLVFDLLDQNGNKISVGEDFQIRLNLNGEQLTEFNLVTTQNKDVHYIFVVQGGSEEILRQVLNFVNEQSETDSFTLIQDKMGILQESKGVSKEKFGQILLDNYYSPSISPCLGDQIVEAVMQARLSREELQAVLIISNDKNENGEACVFDPSGDIGQISQQPFFPVPLFYLMTQNGQLPEQMDLVLQKSGGEKIISEISTLKKSLDEAALKMHSKSVLQFDAAYEKSINVLNLLINTGETQSGLDLYFTWDNLGKKYAVTLEESSKNLSILNLESNIVKIPKNLYYFVKYFLAVLIPVSLMGAVSLFIYLRKGKNETVSKGVDGIVPDSNWFEFREISRQRTPSLRILQSDEELLIGRLIHLNKNKTSIGRGLQNDIVFEMDKNLLENQVVLTQKGGYVSIEESSKAAFKSNMDSPTFGTFLNNSRLGTQAAILNDGDIICLGPSVILEFKYC